VKNITIGELAAKVAEIALQQIQDSLSTIQLTERDVVGEAMDGVFGAQRSIEDEEGKTARMRSMLDEAAVGRAPGIFERPKPTCTVKVFGRHSNKHEDVTGTLVDADGFLILDMKDGGTITYHRDAWNFCVKEPYHAEA